MRPALVGLAGFAVLYWSTPPTQYFGGVSTAPPIEPPRPPVPDPAGLPLADGCPTAPPELAAGPLGVAAAGVEVSAGAAGAATASGVAVGAAAAAGAGVSTVGAGTGAAAGAAAAGGA
jgi:hypothetical protein